MEYVLPALSPLAIQIPLLLVWLFGCILAVVRWSRHPRVSMLTLVAILGLATLTLIGTATSVAVPMMMYDQGWTASQMSMILMMSGFSQSLFTAVLWLLLFAAIFGWRTEPSPEPDTPADEPIPHSITD